MSCLLAVGLLAGCASVGQRAPAGVETISGKLSVRVEASESAPARSESGDFELKGNPADGQLNLSSPLGTVMAQARWSGQRAWLTTAQGETAYPDLETLSQEMLGERLPVEALFDWLHGRPWAGAPSRPAADIAGFEQLGWAVDLTRFGEGWVSARRAHPPAVLVRARVDRP
ncbi:MAG: outer membrane lipoprotein LolB [Rhizobacter sp.]|nr:outer membrane lipoprotein LolB [Rhizobacter sp.]